MLERRLLRASLQTGLLLALIGCSHPRKDNGGDGSSGGNTGTSTGGTGTAGDGSTSGGTAPGTTGGTGTAGNTGTSGTNGTTGGSGNGANGGSGNPNGGNATASGGGGVIVGGAGGGAAPKMSCTDSAYSDPYTPGYKQDAAVVSQVMTTLNSLSLTDRANQMRGTATGSAPMLNYSDIFRTPDNGTAKIAGFKFRDGPRGVNLAAELPAGQKGYSTVFPVPMARGASFDLDLELRIGRAQGDEMLASKHNMMLAPTINLLRHPAWGRAQETYGEDPYLLGRMGSAYTVGVQEYVPACAKHYAGNNIEEGRETITSHFEDDQTLREIYARHFEMVIKDGGVACVMASYNLVSVGSGAATKATMNKLLLTDLLRTEFGFKGFVLSDWWAMPPGQTVPSADTQKGNASTGVTAGLDMELPWSMNYSQLESSGLPATAITTAAGRILEQKYRFKIDKVDSIGGLKAPTTTYVNGSIENNQANINLAEEAATKGMVLLKNDKNTLPFKKDAIKSIAVIGAAVAYTVTNTDNANGTINFATDVRTGDLGSSRAFHDPAKSMGPFDGIKAAAGSGITVTSGSAASAAASADAIVVVAGLTPQDEGEEYTGAGDRKNFSLDGKQGGTAQNNLIAQVAALGKPTVVVLEGGSVIDMPWLSQVSAVVMAWYPGQVGGKALGNLLFGAANFSGKLPFSWPAKWADLPTFNAGTSTDMGYYVGYRYFDNKNVTPLFPFGFGLSYTTFEYSNLQLPCSDVTKNGVVNVQVDVKNTGTAKGDEVVFVFTSYPGSTARRPLKELKGFTRVSLDPGQTKQVTIPVRVSDLKYYDQTAKAWTVASGSVQFQVGSSAATLPLKDTLVVK
jgi:beta-glucosidase